MGISHLPLFHSSIVLERSPAFNILSMVSYYIYSLKKIMLNEISNLNEKMHKLCPHLQFCEFIWKMLDITCFAMNGTWFRSFKESHLEEILVLSFSLPDYHVYWVSEVTDRRISQAKSFKVHIWICCKGKSSRIIKGLFLFLFFFFFLRNDHLKISFKNTDNCYVCRCLY